MKRFFAAVGLGLCAMPAPAAEPLIWFSQMERLEYQDAESITFFDAQGFVGRDLNKFWWKAEGELGDEDEFELQALYSRAISPFFDIQAGVHQLLSDERDATSLVVGFQGLAPLWFEIDVATLISDDGDLALSFEAEYDLLLTQKLIIQPIFELSAGTSEFTEALTGSGLRDTEFGIRLRYEITRKIAPYAGISWTNFFGETKDLRRAAGLDSRSDTIVAGLRFWF